MQQRLLFLLRLLVALLLIFFIAKVAFFWFNGTESHQASWADLPSVWWHGLPLDLATAGYCLVLPWLLMLLSIWMRPAFSQFFFRAYTVCVALLFSLIFVSDTCLYSFWDFKLDGTVFTYLDNLQGATQSITALYIIGVVVAFCLVAVTCYFLLDLAWWRCDKEGFLPIHLLQKKMKGSLCLLLIGGIIFLAIRGGVGRSTANVGMVYYSNNQYLNHTAVNPVFSIFYSLKKTANYAEQYNIFEEEKRSRLFDNLCYNTASLPTDTLLSVQRPNVLIIIMEGCGAPFIESLGGASGVTPCLERLASEGVLFSRCYANSFRTDRGTISALSGYPSFPDVSVMKLTAKSRTLPSIAATLQEAGYATEFLYGGDKNFTNMNSYLMATGYQRTYGDKDFPPEVRRTHAWGVTDHIAFERLWEMVQAYPTDRPWHTTFLTLSSHEPWQVPYSRIEGDKRANAMAYLDQCIGTFTDSLRQSPLWDNTLLVLLPDHSVKYPDSVTDASLLRYHIPMIWSGGAVKAPRTIEHICNQSDLAATLLGQMGLPHDDFKFSRDVTSSSYTYPSASYTWSGGLAFIDSTGHSVLDLASGRLLADEPQPSALRMERGKAFLQTCYDDLGAR